MNEYKVTKGFDDAGITVTAIDEKDARRIYRQTHCPEEVRAASFTLIRENVPATKQQEREAVERIRAIIETLGPRSYVAEAMDADVIIWAMQYAIDEHKSSWSYIRATLKAYKDQGIRTLADLQRANDAHKRAKQRREDTRNNGSNRRSPAGRPAGPAEPPGDPLKGFSTGEE